MARPDITAGRVPDPELVHLIELLFSDQGAMYGLGRLMDNDPLAEALTGNHTADLWRAWRAARKLFAQAQPLDAFKRLTFMGELYPIDMRHDGLADLERLALIAECLVEGNQPIAAYDICEKVREHLFNFVRKMQTNPYDAADEVRGMFTWMVGVRALRNDLTGRDLLDAWVLGRGLDMLLTMSFHMVNLLVAARERDDARRIAKRLVSDIATLHEMSGCAFDRPLRAMIEFTLGNCWTEIEPKRALRHFNAVVKLSSSDQILQWRAEVNAANCLVRLQRYDEARARYSQIESVFEMYGDYLGAARVWTSECIAEWKQTHDISVIHSLVGAIKLFEDNLSPSADVGTLYTLKKYIEPAYLLLISIVSESDDRSEERLNELVSALWALLSRDFKADLEPDIPTSAWDAMLTSERRPLAIIKSLLAPFPGIGVVHLCAATDCLVWVAYGYDISGRFLLEISLAPPDQIDALRDFLGAMYAQLAADMHEDPAQVQRWSEELVRLGELIGTGLQQPFVDFLLSMNHLYYMPHPFGDIDEFPLAGLRIGGAWLNSHCTVTRSPTINHLRESLAPNRPLPLANPRAVIVTGDAAFEGNLLRQASQEAGRVQHLLSVYGFRCELSLEARSATVRAWLDGDAGVVHYIGHGHATTIDEGLPLTSGDVFGTLDIDHLTGAMTPFVFLCACEAGRIRHGGGGYQIGLASKLAERGAPAVLAFSMPIPETRAYAITHSFYKQAFRYPFGQAVRESQQLLTQEVPIYAWLALTPYGDPDFQLAALAGHGNIVISATRAGTWHSKLRSYATLRTDMALQHATESVDSVPASLRPLLNEFLAYAFLDPPASTVELLDRLEEQALATGVESAPGLLSLRAAICLERAHLIGLDAYPLRWPQPGEATRKLVYDLHFATVVGSTLFDIRLNGLGCALLGRLITWDQNNLTHSATFLYEAIEKLFECTALSPYLQRIRQESILIIQQFGGDT